MASMGIFDSNLASCQQPICASLMFRCAHNKPWRVKGKEKRVIRSESETATGDNTSLDALTSSTPAIIPQMSCFLTSDRFWAATVFFTMPSCTCKSTYNEAKLSPNTSSQKQHMREWQQPLASEWRNFTLTMEFIAEKSFKSDLSDNNQTISYCGVGAHFHNGISKAAIKQLK